MEKVEFVKDYRDNPGLRASFNALAGEIFGLDFEDWYQNGYWGDSYNPYSILAGGRVVANVSVNLTDFLWDGCRKQFIQLGTVMTAPEYRNQGLIRRLMGEIEKDFGQQTDGIYLFANDSVLNFYPKFGFYKAEEYQYTKPVSIEQEQSIVQVPMRDKTAWAALEEALRTSLPCGRFQPIDNPGLTMFYITKYMQGNVYYNREKDAYAIAEVENGELLLHQIVAKEQVSLEEIIQSFGREISRVRLGFTPADADGYTAFAAEEEDTALFLKGAGFDGFAQSCLMFPPLAHA